MKTAAIPALLLLIISGSIAYADDLPVCSNRIINEVMRRSGCTIGDPKCWFANGGFCMDYVQKKTGARQPFQSGQWQQIGPEAVRKGDVAQFFTPRAHLAFVEAVVRDKQGRPRAVDVSEFNFGKCWVDQDTMVTDTYKKVTRRSNIPISSVDGGFLRP